MTEELWKDIPGFEGEYQASTWGRIRGVDRIDRAGRRWKGRIISQGTSRDGYKYVKIYSNATGKKGEKFANTHVLVCLAFHGEPPQDGKRYDVNHIDLNHNNNQPENLEWLTRAQNLEHARRMGVKFGQRPGEQNTRAKLNGEQVRAIRARWDAGPVYRGLINQLAIVYGVSEQTMRSVVYRITWTGEEYEPERTQPLPQGAVFARSESNYAA